MIIIILRGLYNTPSLETNMPFPETKKKVEKRRIERRIKKNSIQRYEIIKSWIKKNAIFIVIIGMFSICIWLLMKQQKQIDRLMWRVSDVSQIESKLNDIEGKIENLESNLNSEISDIRRTIIFLRNYP
ncbi:hypothetical protein EDL98_00940 [Ornithobacterium rhinotracheale]|nr:hypothetical protein [Ornithobacterium rhinotracheale]